MDLSVKTTGTDPPATQRSVQVWDRTTRVFHWLNALCVLGLVGVGTVILYAGDLGVSNEGKVALKTIHVWIGYVFVLNLAWRLVWGFIGGPYARWSAILPGGRGYASALVASATRLLSPAPAPEPEPGHSPLGRLAVSILLAALFVQGATGLILAGTDVYMPPFGGYFAEWVAGPDLDPSQVQPYAPESVDEAMYADMRAFRAPVIDTHLATYFILLALILLHIAAVVIVELRSGGNIISAMFTGEKSIPTNVKRPEVEDRGEQSQ